MKWMRQMIVSASLLTMACAVFPQESSPKPLGTAATVGNNGSQDEDVEVAVMYPVSPKKTKPGPKLVASAAPQTGDAVPQEHKPAAETSTSKTSREVPTEAPVPPQISAAGSENKRKKHHADADEERDPTLPPPLSLSGTLIGGYYQAETLNGHISSQGSAVGSLKLDASGYYHSPAFLKFSIKPQTSLGRQSSESVFPDGQGVAATTTFLGGSFMPFTVSYTRLDRKIVTFGPLDRLAGLDANTSQNALTLDWRIHQRNLPALDLSYSRYNDANEPLQDLAPKTDNEARLFSATLSDSLAGWKWQSRYRQERSQQDLTNIFDPTQAPYNYSRLDRMVDASATRDFAQRLSLDFQGGYTKADSRIGGTPYDQSFHYVNGASTFRPTEKLTLGFRAGYTSNLVGAVLQQTVASSGPGGATNPAAQSLLTVPSKARLTLQTYDGRVQYALTNDLRFDGEVRRETTHTPSGSGLVAANSTLDSAQTGVSYSHQFRLWQFRSQYSVNGGRFDYGLTGISRSFGQRANLSFTFGSPDWIEFTAGLQGSMQDLRGATNLRDRSWGGTLTAARNFFQSWQVRATYNRERNDYSYTLTEYDSSGQGGAFSVIGPLLEFNVTHQMRDGLTFQADPRLQFLSSTDAAALSGAFPGVLVAPTSAKWTHASLSFHPASRLKARAAWLRNRQSLNGALTNNYREWEISAGYQFRNLTMDVGYILHRQDFGADFFRRNRFFFRIAREFRVF
ncbi:MAG: hypothetical protein ACE14L_12600 [Terriglobales bacterium]